MQSQTTTQATTHDIEEIARQLAEEFRPRAAEIDASAHLPPEHYQRMRETGYLRAVVPEELGGGGAGLLALARAQQALARGCAGTALAVNMHMFQVGFAVDGWRNGAPVEPLLRRVAEEGIVLGSTGAEILVPGAWATSATAEKVDGGYRINARKAFCSQAPVMDIVRLNARDAETGEILVISVPASTPGVTIEQTWDTLGMRASESHHVSFENVDVPEGAVGARLPADGPAQTPAIAGVATWFLSTMSSVYLGIAEEARSVALDLAGTGNNSSFRAPELTDVMRGEMETAFRTAEAVRDQIVGGLDQDRSDPQDAMRRALVAKEAIIANAERTVDQAMQLAGAQAYFRRCPLERLARDMRAGRFHPPAAPTSMQMVGQRVSA